MGNKMFQPSLSAFKELTHRHDVLLKFAEKHADDPTGILSDSFNYFTNRFFELKNDHRRLKERHKEKCILIDSLLRERAELIKQENCEKL